MAKRVPVKEVLKLSKGGYSDADIIRYLRGQGYSPTQINDAMNQAKIKLELAETAGVEPSYEDYGSEPAESAEQEATEQGAAGPEAAGSAAGAGAGMTPSIMTSQTPAPSTAPLPSAEAPAEQGGEAYPYQYPSTYGNQQNPSAESMEEIAEEIINEKWQEFKKEVGDIKELKTYFESRLKDLTDRVKRLETSFDKLQAATMGHVQEYGRNVKNLGAEMQALEGSFSKILNPLVGSVKELRELSKGMKEKTKKPKQTKKIKTKNKK